MIIIIKSFRRLVALVVAASILLACERGETARILFKEPEIPTATNGLLPPVDNVLRLAVAPVLSPVQNLAMYQEFLDYLGAKLERPVQMVQGKTYAEINELVRTGAVTLAIVCTNPYLDGREEFGMEALVVPEVQKSTFYYSLLIVPQDSGVTSLSGLRGGTFAYTDPLSNSGRLAPLYQLALKGENPETFFRRYVFTYAHDNSIRLVAQGAVDGAAVDSLVYDYLSVTDPQLIAKVRVVEKWGPFGNSPIVVNPRLDPDLKARLQSVLLDMDADARGREILSKMMIDRFVVPNDSIYDSVRQMRSHIRDRLRGGQ